MTRRTPARRTPTWRRHTKSDDSGERGKQSLQNDDEETSYREEALEGESRAKRSLQNDDKEEIHVKEARGGRKRAGGAEEAEPFPDVQGQGGKSGGPVNGLLDGRAKHSMIDGCGLNSPKRRRPASRGWGLRPEAEES